MRFTVRIGDELTTSAEGREMPPPPDLAVAALLLGLLASEHDWISRAEVARRLYPKSTPEAARNALRQATFRLRRWLGTEVLDSRAGFLRLTPGTIMAQWSEDVPSERPGTLLDHPWIEAIWDARRRRPSAPHFVDFARAVESAAEVDVDAARGILIGGSALVMGMPDDVSRRLLKLTKPSDVRSPWAFEYLAVHGELDLHTLLLARAKTAFRQAYRLAIHRRSATQAFRAATMMAFVHIEAGDMPGAASWLDRCDRHDGTRSAMPLRINAHAAFLWNSDRLEAAVTLMREAASRADPADAPHLLHYWTNCALLASEAEDFELALQADEEARRLAKPGIHMGYLGTLDLARATRLTKEGRADESLRAFEALRRSASKRTRAARAYVDEAYAEALARAGEIRLAAEIWSRAEADRRAANVRLTPRLEARKARILLAS